MITLTGDASVTVQASLTGSYVDAGATADDSLDGDLTDSIIVSGDVVDLSTRGTYLVQFDVQDTAGNTADTVVRSVTVADDTLPVITLLRRSVCVHRGWVPLRGCRCDCSANI